MYNVRLKENKTMSIEQITEDILLRKIYYNRHELKAFLTQTITNINSSFLDYHIYEDRYNGVFVMVMTEFCFYYIIIEKDEIQAVTSPLNSLNKIWRKGENPLGGIEIKISFENFFFEFLLKIGDTELTNFLQKVETQAIALKNNYFNTAIN
jgi:hypothetical protein